MMSLDPIKTTESITKRYFAYLNTTFHLKDPVLRKQVMDELQTPKNFIKGPYLEATLPFKFGKTLDELINEGILSTQFRNLKCEELPLDRQLYEHQEIAIRRAIGDNRNIVVATGTGSGKTEVFIITILNYLFRQSERSELSPGVRALLLYPMNALVNDQLKRLHILLKNCPDITFGRYTGETRDDQKKALEEYKKMFNEEPLENELVSRDEMKKSPPHILLTNYAMLEYLLLRPDDNVFFDEFAGNWKFIVIDEAHTYYGAKGIEMAMLLRRLKDRVVKSKPGKLQCIATSATLGGGEDDADVTKFAGKLFGESFEEKDVVRATRIEEEFGEPWGKPSPSLYEEWKKIINESNDVNIIQALFETGKKNNVPIDELKGAMDYANNDYKRFLFYILRRDENLISLRKLLDEKPWSLNDVSEVIFPNYSMNALTALVDIAIKAKPHKDDQPLIPARYHLFVRAIEGAYICLYPEEKIYLERHEYHKVGDKKYPVFEIAACRQCGAVFLVGETEENTKILKQAGAKYFENNEDLEYYLIEKNENVILENEDKSMSPKKQKWEKYKICRECGTTIKKSKIENCNCKNNNYLSILKYNEKGDVHKCPACARENKKGSTLLRFLLGKDATASVLATSLYQQIPDKNNCRRLLIFSDSRQDAAFFAPYLNKTYSKILRRQLILKSIYKNNHHVINKTWRIDDLKDALLTQTEQIKYFLEGTSLGQKEKELYKWILYELLTIDSKISLERLGLLGFSLKKSENFKPMEQLTRQPWNLSEDEVWTLFKILLDTFRDKGAIKFPDNVNHDESFFKPENHESYFREDGSSKQSHVDSWLPSKENYPNARLEFIGRLAKELSLEITSKDCRDILREIWNKTTDGILKNYFSNDGPHGEGIAYRIDYKFWELQPGIINKEIQWYLCDTCNNLTLLNLRNICPEYKCRGTLIKCNPDENENIANNHYRKLYLDEIPFRMKAEEHTAQIESKRAASIQTDFNEGKVNVLSCSTTFELGVDVGQLESVFLKNVPPSSANYIQRAGRAGRRTDSTAFALTFCQRSSHDLNYFNDPVKMISGKVKTPHFDIMNEKIVLRHVYATALASFWRKKRDMFKDVNSFFFNNGPELFKNYLDEKPQELYEALRRIMPDETFHQLKDFRLEQWGWVEGLFDEKKGILLNVAKEVKSDVDDLKEASDKRYNEGKNPYPLMNAIKTIKDKYLLNFLSSHNIIPKYGFPVDVVEMQVVHHKEGENLELNRDLRIALSEYAPGSHIVAGGKLWTSQYLKKLPNKSWLKYRYAICSNCNLYQRVMYDSDKKLDLCNNCKTPLEPKNPFIIPAFGFIVSNKQPDEPGEEHPKKSYSTRIYYSGDFTEKIGLPVTVPLKNNVTLHALSAAQGTMAIINNGNNQGFKVCSTCGYAIIGKPDSKHEDPYGYECKGSLSNPTDLGHEFKTDILQLQFEGCCGNKEYKDYEFWLSLLYALLEGTSEALDIERRDIDGCLYPYGAAIPALVLFDDVPGGAGHVRRIAQNPNTIRQVFESAYNRMKGCKCGGDDGDASCYGCLRNYQNQFCHDKLNRGKVIRFLEMYFFNE